MLSYLYFSYQQSRFSNKRRIETFEELILKQKINILFLSIIKFLDKWIHSEKKFLDKLKEFTPQFYSPKIPNLKTQINEEIVPITPGLRKIKSITQIPEIDLQTRKNNKFQRILRYHMGLCHNKSVSISTFPSKKISETSNFQCSRSNLMLAQDSVYNSLYEKKMQIFKSYKTENKSHSALIKQRDSLTQKLLANLNKNFEKDKKKSNLLDFYENRKKILTMYERIENYPISIFHFKNFNDLRIIEDYKITTPKLCLHPAGHPCKSSLKNITFGEVFESLLRIGMVGEINKENFSSIFEIKNEIFDKIRVFTYTGSIAIPYLIIKSKLNNKKPKQILFILHDFFDNFMEHITFYQEISDIIKNCKIILFNYPGQLFTLYDEEKLFNNEEIAKILDELILDLEKQKVIDLQKDIIKLLGLGYGGNIAAYFTTSCEGSFKSLHSIMLMNSFVYIDEMLFGKIQELLNVFESNIGEELSLIYYFQMTQTVSNDKEKIQKKLKKNPLNNNVKKFILQGCLESINCELKFRKCETFAYIVHSLQNSFISVIHADILNEAKDSKNLLMKIPFENDKTILNYSNSPQKRICAYIDGGHDIIEVIILIFF